MTERYIQKGRQVLCPEGKVREFPTASDAMRFRHIMQSLERDIARMATLMSRARAAARLPLIMSLAGAALLLVAALCPADAAEAVTLPVSAHALRHATVVAMITFAAALVAWAVKTGRAG